MEKHFSKMSFWLQSGHFTNNVFIMEKQAKILLLEGISQVAIDTFKKNWFQNIELLPNSLEGDDLISKISDVDYIGIRSRTQLTKTVLNSAKNLKAIGCFCIGTNQVDIDYAMEMWVPVFNAPFSNTRSVAELIIGETIMLMRWTFERSNAAHRGEWLKNAKNSYEVRGKTIGIIGYGHIGTQVSVLAESMGMKVVYFDVIDKLPLGNAVRKETLEELFQESDVVTLHVPQLESTKNMINAKTFSMMKEWSYLINASRGSVVDIDALVENLTSWKLKWASIDVFPKEPKGKDELFVSPLQWMPNVILTPHVGGSTQEAQTNIGLEVASKLISYYNFGNTDGAVNYPQVSLPPIKEGCRRVQFIHQNIPGMMAAINREFGDRGIQIFSQFLDTKGSLGYAILDVQQITQEMIEEMELIEGTIKLNFLN